MAPQQKNTTVSVNPLACLRDEHARIAGEVACQRVQQFDACFSKNPPQDQDKTSSALMELTWDDVQMGKILGHGGFSCVYQVTLSSTSSRKAETPLALKCLHGKTKNDLDTYCTGAADLALEARILCRLSKYNPKHIVQLRGYRRGALEDSFQDHWGYFLVLERLNETLDQRLMQWDQRQQKRLLKTKRLARRQQLARLNQFAKSICEAVCFLHRHRILYRDLKPQNVGLDVQGRVKLFDFGLCRELYQDDDRIFTGCVGTQPYMAPEVARSELYGVPVDVYAYGMILWELCTLQVPFQQEGIDTADDYQQQVLVRGLRPSLDLVAVDDMADLIAQCWQEDPLQRPTFAGIQAKLEQFLR